VRVNDCQLWGSGTASLRCSASAPPEPIRGNVQSPEDDQHPWSSGDLVRRLSRVVPNTTPLPRRRGFAWHRIVIAAPMLELRRLRTRGRPPSPDSLHARAADTAIAIVTGTLLLSASEYRGHHARAAPSVHDSHNPQGLFLWRVGNQVFTD